MLESYTANGIVYTTQTVREDVEFTFEGETFSGHICRRVFVNEGRRGVARMWVKGVGKMAADFARDVPGLSVTIDGEVFAVLDVIFDDGLMIAEHEL